MHLLKLTLSLLTFTSLAAAAVPAPIQARINTGARLIQVAEDKPAEWMNEDGIFKLIREHKHFMDITDEAALGESYERLLTESRVQTFAPPAAPSQQAIVNPLLKQVSIPSLTNFLTNFSSFPTRYYKNPSGTQSSQWLFDTISGIAAASPLNIKVSKFAHNGYNQFSVIARIEGTDPTAPLVIIGGHQDSINSRNPSSGSSPGADDDGSGSTSIYEIYRILASTASFKPTRPIEFQWYAGEEAGLLGSQNIAQTYKTRGVKVAGMLQLDMTGYLPQNRAPYIAIITDFTDAALTEFLRKLVVEYTDAPVRNTTCGYGCSDHASWNRAGFPSCFPTESTLRESTPFIHTADDKIGTVNFGHVARFAKLGLGFIVEMSA
ncbi:hypothetical protein HDV05_005228 [Chytridiales sp. JEL 0842]|nr:hypothetical protein HDV05_005228 [Chytridiales sp. JEL 0842]